jgi:hypothetical protein
MRRVPPFAVGHVLGAFVLGVGSGSFLDLKAMMVFGTLLAAGASVSALVCWWRPGFRAAGWKLWFMACLGNPLFLVAAVFSVTEYECLVRLRTGWNCMFSDLGALVAGACCLPPFAGLAWRWWRRRAAA